jgi:hypothetical protein
MPSCSNREVIDPMNLARPMAIVDGAGIYPTPFLAHRIHSGTSPAFARGGVSVLRA